MKTNYETLHKQVQSMFENEPNINSNMANLTALVYSEVKNLNWVGFYLWSEKENCLMVNTFQGKPACVRIKKENGVCGASYLAQNTIVVSDVNKFPNHIECDSDSRSEIVIPLFDKAGKIIGVFDIDSPQVDRFSFQDKIGLEKVIEIFGNIVDISGIQK